MILSDYFNLESVSENTILTVSKATQVWKVAETENLCAGFLKMEQNFYPNLSVIYLIFQLPLKTCLILVK